MKLQKQKTRNFGDYQTISNKLVGGGGQALIFRVKNVKTNEVLALKSYKIIKRRKNERIIRRYNNEVEVLRKLKGHKNIIEIIDWGIEDSGQYKYYYIVMEMAEENLDDIVNKGLTINKKLEIYEQILDGVKYIHSKNIIHRDLKPKNILIKDGIIKIIDFGITLDELRERITRTDEWVGSKFYMAPELEEGRDDNIDSRCDIYSLGKVLYFILSNGKIFNREKFRDENWNLANNFIGNCLDCFNLFFERTICLYKESRYLNLNKLLEDFQNCKRDFELCPSVIDFQLNLYENDSKLPPIDLPSLYDWLEKDLKDRLSESSSPFYFIDDHRNGEYIGLKTVFHKLTKEEFERLNLDWWEVGNFWSFYELYSKWECIYCEKFLNELDI